MQLLIKGGVSLKKYSNQSSINSQPALDIPNQGWNLLEKSDIALSFTHEHMIAYFVDRKASDNLQAHDIKSTSDQAYALSERDHTQNIELATDFGTNYKI